MSFGMKDWPALSASRASTTGWRPRSISMHGLAHELRPAPVRALATFGERRQGVERGQGARQPRESGSMLRGSASSSCS